MDEYSQTIDSSSFFSVKMIIKLVVIIIIIELHLFFYFAKVVMRLDLLFA